MKVIWLFFLLVDILFAQSASMDNLLTTIEQGNFVNLLLLKAQDARFDPQKIVHVRSESWLRQQLKSQRGTILFQNTAIRDSILLNRDNVRAARLVFMNCSFPQKVVIENAAISSHLAFIGCRFEEELLIERLSCENITLLSNSMAKAVRITEAFGEDQVGQLLVAYNSMRNFYMDSFNAHLNMKYAGKLVFKSINLLFNIFETARLSGAVCSKLAIVFGNIAGKIEFNDLKLDYLLSIKFNVIDSCRIVNLMERENALIAIANNSFQHLLLYNNMLRFISVSDNLLQSIALRNLVVNLSLQLHNNSFEKNTKIVVHGDQFANFSLLSDGDTIQTVAADTLDKQWTSTSDTLFANAPAFPLPGGKSGQKRYVRIKQIKHVIDDSNFYSLSISNTNIDEKNWHIHFDLIRKIDGAYRLNPQDSVLASRHEVYTAIYNAYRRQGRWKQADDCYYEWKQFERRNFLKLSDAPFFFKLPQTVFHHLNWISCGYGIKPLRIFPFAVLIVCLFALIYFATPERISNVEQHLVSMDKIKTALNKFSSEALQKRFADYDFDFEKHKQDLIDDIVSSIDKDELSRLLELQARSRYNLNYLWNCFYFSFSTFTTVGLGDWYPTGNFNRAVVMIEGALGWLSLGLFITTYANVLLR